MLCGRFGAFDDGVISSARRTQRLLHETEEELARLLDFRRLKPEREFIEVVRQVLACHCPLVAAEQPALQEGATQWTRGIN